jgi:hypothetical protein
MLLCFSAKMKNNAYYYYYYHYYYYMVAGQRNQIITVSVKLHCYS